MSVAFLNFLFCRGGQTPVASNRRAAAALFPYRGLTSAEVSTALRPFYFLVHPDLFGRFPEERATNEASLQSLQSLLAKDAHLQQQSNLKKSRTLKFFLKPQMVVGDQGGLKVDRLHLRPVFVRLEAGVQPREVVRTVLKEARLPTSYLESLPGDDNSKGIPNVSKVVEYPSASEDQEELFRREEDLPSTDTRRPLELWLSANVSTARERIERAAPRALKVRRIQDELCRDLCLANLYWHSDWNKEHRLATLGGFKAMAANHRVEVAPVLKNRTVIFGNRQSGLSLDGEIVLYAGEVPNNWLSAIKAVPQTERLLEMIPLAERALSQSLRGARVVHRANKPIALADDYRRRLRQLVTTLGDYRSRRRFPDSWPESMRQVEMCVETEASPLMLTPEGVFVVPANCPDFLLVNFISENLVEASRRRQAAREAALREPGVLAKCAEELGLIALEREDGVDAAAMIECCVRLTQAADRFRHLTHGNHLMVAKYYSVSADGVICIPWNWVDQ